MTTGPASHVPITQATLLAAFTTVAGQVIAFVPSLAQYQAIAISIVSAALSLGFLIANAIHAHSGTITPVAPVTRAAVAPVSFAPSAVSSADVLRAQVRELGATPEA